MYKPKRSVGYNIELAESVYYPCTEKIYVPMVTRGYSEKNPSASLQESNPRPSDY